MTPVTPSNDDFEYTARSKGRDRRSTTSLVAAVLLGLMAASLLPGCAEPDPHELTLRAGDYDRAGTIASFEPPTGAAAGAWELIGPDGERVPVQTGLDGRLRFRVSTLDAGTSRRYRLRRRADDRAAETVSDTTRRVRTERTSDRVRVEVGSRPLLSYRIEPDLPRPELDTLYRRAGYLHPVRSPAGRTVTGDYPPDHAHHHGIWAAWTNTRFRGRSPDFWNTPDGTGTVRVESVDSVWSGPVEGGLRSRHRYVDRSADEPVTVLRETWTVRALGVTGPPEAPRRVFDVVVRHENVTDDPLVLPEYHYGGFAVRGHLSWDDTSRVEFLTSAGRDRADGNETRARWVHLGGTVSGDSVGVAVLSHPSNFRAPQPVRIHPTMPYFCFAPSQAGEWRIGPDEVYEARYRVVTYDGPPDADRLDEIWNAWTDPPEVRVRTP